MISELRLALLCTALLAAVGSLAALTTALIGSPVWSWEPAARALFAIGVFLTTALIVVWREI